VATLLLAADAGPARAAEPEPAHTAHLSNPVKSAGR
jgi:hypothetical protein